MSVDNIAAELSKCTVKDIKIWAQQNGLKTPQLKKEALITYLAGAYYEKITGMISTGKNLKVSLDVLQPKYADPNLDWLVHLHTHGWAVTSIPNWNPNFTDMFFNWFEQCCPNFKKHDHTTWIPPNLPIMSHGILKHYFGQTEMQWLIRELCVDIFARIWQCSPTDLLCSFDGGCFLPTIPKEVDSTFKQWIHNDSHRSQPHFCSVQGVVNFVENGPEDGGLILVEGSHTIFAEYMAKHPSEGITWGPVDMNDPLLSNRPIFKICAPPGSIILFDSRICHTNCQPSGSILRSDNTPRFRICTYVSMAPRIHATQKELAKRIQLYEKGRQTGHNVFGEWFKETSEHPNTYGKPHNKPSTIEIATLNPLRSRLIGYE